MRTTTVNLIALFVWCLATPASSQDKLQRNLEICLSGKYPALCKHGALTPDQLPQARAAEQRENLKICLTGKYAALCDHSKLDGTETVAVKEAERVENLTVCSTGKYPALCKHSSLSPTELRQVRAAEETENLRVCLDGRYPALCKHSLLTPQQAKDVAGAETKSASARPHSTQQSALPSPGGGGCDVGHWIESVDGDGKIIKLEDGSLWKVSDLDTVTTMIWLPVSEVVVCGTKMINVDDDESVTVTRLAPGPAPRVPALEPTTATKGYAIQASANDETLVINGEIFKAKTYCFNFDKGDRVIFVSGSPSGACASARLLNVRTGRTCDVWCE